jgi:solute carrier family 6 (neurotransmitter transporter)
MLYRPVIETRRPAEGSDIIPEPGVNGTTAVQIEDPPPKYTPPPSYSTATGARSLRFTELVTVYEND